MVLYVLKASKFFVELRDFSRIASKNIKIVSKFQYLAPKMQYLFACKNSPSNDSRPAITSWQPNPVDSQKLLPRTDSEIGFVRKKSLTKQSSGTGDGRRTRKNTIFDVGRVGIERSRMNAVYQPKEAHELSNSRKNELSKSGKKERRKSSGVRIFKHVHKLEVDFDSSKLDPRFSKQDDVTDEAVISKKQIVPNTPVSAAASVAESAFSSIVGVNSNGMTINPASSSNEPTPRHVNIPNMKDVALSIDQLRQHQTEKCTKLLKELVEVYPPSSRTSNFSSRHTSGDESYDVMIHDRIRDHAADVQSSDCDSNAGERNRVQIDGIYSSSDEDHDLFDKEFYSPNRRRRQTPQMKSNKKSWFLQDLADLAACAAHPFVSSVFPSNNTPKRKEKHGSQSARIGRRRVPVQREKVTYHVI